MLPAARSGAQRTSRRLPGYRDGRLSYHGAALRPAGALRKEDSGLQLANAASGLRIIDSMFRSDEFGVWEAV